MIILKKILGWVVIAVGSIISLISIVSFLQGLQGSSESGIHLVETIVGKLIFVMVWGAACVFIIRLGIKWTKGS
ncbi:MAG TPA: hypothetical protein VIU12_24100 [Chryseolinea sp.]